MRALPTGHAVPSAIAGAAPTTCTVNPTLRTRMHMQPAALLRASNRRRTSTSFHALHIANVTSNTPACTCWHARVNVECSCLSTQLAIASQDMYMTGTSLGIRPEAHGASVAPPPWWAIPRPIPRARQGAPTGLERAWLRYQGVGRAHQTCKAPPHERCTCYVNFMTAIAVWPERCICDAM